MEEMNLFKDIELDNKCRRAFEDSEETVYFLEKYMKDKVYEDEIQFQGIGLIASSYPHMLDKYSDLSIPEMINKFKVIEANKGLIKDTYINEFGKEGIVLDGGYYVCISPNCNGYSVASDVFTDQGCISCNGLKMIGNTSNYSRDVLKLIIKSFIIQTIYFKKALRCRLTDDDLVFLDDFVNNEVRRYFNYSKDSNDLDFCLNSGVIIDKLVDDVHLVVIAENNNVIVTYNNYEIIIPSNILNGININLSENISSKRYGLLLCIDAIMTIDNCQNNEYKNNDAKRFYNIIDDNVEDICGYILSNQL